ncbi:hypothetical protein [Agrobacterium fabrum]|uniref:hypothetical protein n=1 Tax=Agrobacterium fabrum TaxID=1176649 RepID=UPI00233FC358|nr:hypothetical protein [Agrobacterium fabrum]WCK79906.1 hypothetical protein G6L39_023605 [Agrobacterium fabrum]
MINATVYVAAPSIISEPGKSERRGAEGCRGKISSKLGSIHVSHGHPITLAHMTGAYRLHPIEELSYAVET